MGEGNEGLGEKIVGERGGGVGGGGEITDIIKRNGARGGRGAGRDR